MVGVDPGGPWDFQSSVLGYCSWLPTRTKWSDGVAKRLTLIHAIAVDYRTLRNQAGTGPEALALIASSHSATGGCPGFLVWNDSNKKKSYSALDQKVIQERLAPWRINDMSVIVVTSCFLIGFVPAPPEEIHLWYHKQGRKSFLRRSYTPAGKGTGTVFAKGFGLSVNFSSKQSSLWP